MRWPLRYQILVPIAGIMAAALLGVSLLNAYLAARNAHQRIERQLRDVAGTLADAEFPLTDAVLRQARGLSGAEFVLADERSLPLAASLPGALVLPARPAVPPDEFDLQPVEMNGTRYLHVPLWRPRTPVSDAPSILHILYPASELAEAKREAALPPLVLGMVALALVGGLALVIARRLSRPIVQLQSQVGKLAHGDFHTVPLPARNDELRDLVASVNALAEQLDELRGAIKRSEHMALLGQLSGGLAHHLRNDVTGARMAVQLHQRCCRTVDQESLAVALRQLALAEQQLQRFLTAGRPETPQRVPCDLGHLVHEAIELVEPAFRHRGVRLEVCRLEDGAASAVPASREAPEAADALPDLHGIELSGDPDQLLQLVMNLVLNAFQAAGAGGWVRVELTRSDNQAWLAVCDSGPGPPREILDRLFDPFVTGRPEGIGLGLTVARQVAESHGGTLTYRTGGTTRFEVVLPIDRLPHSSAGDHEIHSRTEEPIAT